jgi:hypothetical protein
MAIPDRIVNSDIILTLGSTPISLDILLRA